MIPLRSIFTFELSRSPILLLGVGVGAAAATAIGFAAWQLMESQVPQQAALSTSEPVSPPVSPPVSAAVSPSMSPAPAEAVRETSAPPAIAPLALPTFDVVRVEPGGEAVVAGRAAPRSEVTLRSGERSLGQASADADGNFVILPQTLPPGEHVLSLRARLGDREVASQQTVTIATPQRGSSAAIAAMDAPNQPTKVLSNTASSVSSPGAGEGGDRLRIASVEAMAGGGAFMSGQAPAGASIRLYLNDSFVASVSAGADGKWSVRIDQGMTPGAYNVRADMIGPDGKPGERAEAPFDLPASAPPAVAAHMKDESAPGAAVVADLRTARVERGDSLWRISRVIYGEGFRYTQIYDANSRQISNPNKIFPGQVLVVPKAD